MGPFSAPSTMDHYLAETITSRSHDLFKARSDRPQLELTTLDRKKDSSGRWSLQVKQSLGINELSQLHSPTVSSTVYPCPEIKEANRPLLCARRIATSALIFTLFDIYGRGRR